MFIQPHHSLEKKTKGKYPQKASGLYLFKHNRNVFKINEQETEEKIEFSSVDMKNY